MIGRVRAYWLTNFMVLFRPRVLAEEVNRPVDYRAAQLFRHVTVILAALPSMAWVIAGYARQFRAWDFWEGPGWVLEMICLAVALVATWLFLLGASGAGSYFFHPRRLPIVQQNRAIALSYYCCASLAWLWLPAASLAAGWIVLRQSHGSDDLAMRIVVPIVMAGSCLVVVIGGIWWMRTTILLQATIHCGTGGELALAVYLPFSLVVVFALCCGLAGFVVLFSLMIVSLT